MDIGGGDGGPRRPSQPPSPRSATSRGREHADNIRAASPFAHTAVNTLANGYNGYIPTEEAFSRPGGYETKYLSGSFLERGAGRKVVAASLDLLREAYAKATPGQ